MESLAALISFTVRRTLHVARFHKLRPEAVAFVGGRAHLWWELNIGRIGEHYGKDQGQKEKGRSARRRSKRFGPDCRAERVEWRSGRSCIRAQDERERIRQG